MTAAELLQDPRVQDSLARIEERRREERRMSEDTTYNGWKNHATWCVNLHLSNDEPLYRETLERTAETIKNPPHLSEYWNEEETARYNVADMLKDWIEEMTETWFDRL